MARKRDDDDGGMGVIEEAVNKLLKESASSDIDTRLKVIDRAIKLQAMKAKIKDGESGSGFDIDD